MYTDWVILKQQHIYHESIAEKSDVKSSKVKHRMVSYAWTTGVLVTHESKLEHLIIERLLNNICTVRS
jgi:hypothetical protein